MLRALKNYNPAALKAKAIKWLAVLGLLAIMCGASYWYGTHTENASWVAKIERQKRDVAEQGGKNAIDAGKRLGDYKYNDAQLTQAVEQAKQMVHDYYAQHPPKAAVVEKTKLVPVPGKPEYVYVPIDSCPNSFLDADELRLYNLGNQGDFADPAHPK